MRFFLDFEFIENGDKHPIIPISIGMVREDGKDLYYEFADVDWSKANPWVIKNIKPTLTGHTNSKEEIVEAIKTFCTVNPALEHGPEFWAYFADYDWVIFCSLFGTMMDLPKGWPKYCLDLKQYMYHLKVKRDQLNFIVNPKLHNALSDAMWNMDAFNVLAAIESSGIKVTSDMVFG